MFSDEAVEESVEGVDIVDGVKQILYKMDVQIVLVLEPDQVQSGVQRGLQESCLMVGWR